MFGSIIGRNFMSSDEIFLKFRNTSFYDKYLSYFRETLSGHKYLRIIRRSSHFEPKFIYDSRFEVDFWNLKYFGPQKLDILRMVQVSKIGQNHGFLR